MLACANKTKGSILFLALLLLSIISVIVVTHIDHTLLQSKIANLQQQDLMAFNRAETLLTKAEQCISQNRAICPQNEIAELGSYTMQLIQETCTQQHIQIDAQATSSQSQSYLRSELLLTKPTTCQGQPQPAFTQRIYWQECDL